MIWEIFKGKRDTTGVKKDGKRYWKIDNLIYFKHTLQEKEKEQNETTTLEHITDVVHEQNIIERKILRNENWEWKSTTTKKRKFIIG